MFFYVRTLFWRLYYALQGLFPFFFLSYLYVFLVKHNKKNFPHQKAIKPNGQVRD